MKFNKNKKCSTKKHMLLLSIVLFGALNWGATAAGYNLVELLSNFVNKSLSTNYPIDKVIYVIVALVALWLASKKQMWLPFLGRSVLPDSLVPLKTPTQSNLNIKIKTRPNSKVAYWASLPSKNINTLPNVNKAYDDYSNSGVVMSDSNGEAVLPILEGSAYQVSLNYTVPRHLHYRVLGLRNGMMGKVKTVNY